MFLIMLEKMGNITYNICINMKEGVCMSDREKLFQLVDAIPDYKLCYAITYLQGLTDGGRAELNKETLEAMEEAERIAKDPNVKSYTNVEEMFREILEDET